MTIKSIKIVYDPDYLDHLINKGNSTNDLFSQAVTMSNALGYLVACLNAGEEVDSIEV